MIAASTPKAVLAELLEPVWREEPVETTKTYSLLGARWYAKGLYVKDVKPGSAIQADTLYRVRAGDFVYNRLFAWKGSFAVAEAQHDECYVSNEFPCFVPIDDRVNPRFLLYYLSRETSWNEALGMSTGGTPLSRNRLKEDLFLSLRIPLPDRRDQDRIVATLDAAAARLAEAQRLRREIEEEVDLLLVALAHRSDLAVEEKLAAGWTQARVADIADHVADPVAVVPDRDYPNLGIYSFGKGLFHKPPIVGLETSATTLFRVRAGQFIYSRLFAFEGACGLVTDDYDGMFVSGEYPTFTCKPGVVPEFLYAYFKSGHVWQALAAGSKGLGVRRQRVQPSELLKHELLVPPERVQEQIRAVFQKRVTIDDERSALATELDALLPAVLDRAFKAIPDEPAGSAA